MIHHVDAIAVMSRNVAQESTMTMIHANASVVTLQHVIVLMNMTHIHVSVSVGLMTAIQVSTLTLKHAAVVARNTSPALTTNSSTGHLVSASAGR